MGRCDRGDMVACAEAGIALFTRESPTGADMTTANALVERACDAKVALGCNAVGRSLAGGLGVPRDAKRAAGFFRRACDLGYTRGCVNLAVLLLECEPSSPKGCAELATLSVDGQPATREVVQARALLERACATDVGSCGTLGALLLSEGGTADPNRGRDLLDKACGGGDERACYNLGVAYREGKGARVNVDRATRYFEMACQGGVPESCSNVATKIRNEPTSSATELARARSLYERACTGGIASSCRDLGDMWWRGKGGATDATKSRELESRACDLGYAQGCNDLALLLLTADGGQRDAARARGLLERACSGGYVSACEDLAIAWARGDGGPVDLARARSWLRKACEGDRGPSCLELAGYYQQGLGGPVDAAAQEVLLKHACERGPTWACRPDAPACPEILAKVCAGGTGAPVVATPQAPSCHAKCERLAREHALRAGMSIDECAVQLCQ